MQRNDPLLALAPIENHSRVPLREQLPPKPSGSFRRNISTIKASVQAGVEQKEEDPQSWCLLHNKPHPLRKCRAFMMKSYLEKLKILK